MISKFFINHPTIAIVISILMVIIGSVAMISLPVAQYPEIVPPEIFTSGMYPGADAKTVEQSVATPIESQMSGVDNLNYMYSTNASNGQTSLYTNFDVKTDPNIDQILTQLRVNQAASQLPAEVTAQGVQVLKSMSTPLMVVNLISPQGTYGRDFLSNYATINMKDELARIPGVGRVQIFGGDYAMRVWVEPEKLAKLAVTVPQVVRQSRHRTRSILPGRSVETLYRKVRSSPIRFFRSPGLITADEFDNIVIRANPDGSILHLKDVAHTELGAQTYNIRFQV